MPQEQNANENDYDAWKEHHDAERYGEGGVALETYSPFKEG